VVKLATDALDEVRRKVWNDARRAGQPGLARELKGARFALWMNPERLTDRHKLARVQEINKDLYRAYLICQQLRMIYRVPRSAGARAARAVVEVGTALPLGAVRQARQDDHQPACGDRGGASTRLVERVPFILHLLVGLWW